MTLSHFYANIRISYSVEISVSMNNLPPELLKSLNLSEDQARVYLAALELGQANMQSLSKKSGVKRTSIYYFIDELKARQLIVETKKRQRSVYSAVHPDQLIEIEKTRLHELQRLRPELVALYNASSSKPRVTFYEGIEGIKNVYGDILKERQPLVGWSDIEHRSKILGPFFESYAPERARRNITYKAIIRDTPAARSWAKKNIGHLREYKYVQSDDFDTEIDMYGEKVVIFSFRTTPPYAVIIEDKHVADTMRMAWQQLWNRI